MASTINAITTGAGGIVTTGDSTGIIGLQSNGSTVASVSSTGLAVTGTLSATGIISQNGVNIVAVAPGTSGNLLTSDGTNWTSAAPTIASYLITSSVDITLAAATINGTTGQTGQSNVGSSFTMIIPSTGIITFASIAGKWTNDGNTTTHTATFGIRIGTTNYWFGYNDLSTPSYSYTGFITGGSTANGSTNLYGNGNSTSSGTAIDVVSAGVPTGSQTVQLIAASTSSTTGGTINGATRQTRVKLLTIA